MKLAMGILLRRDGEFGNAGRFPMNPSGPLLTLSCGAK